MVENKEILFYGTRWCGDCKRAMRVFQEKEIPVVFLDIDQDKQAEIFVRKHNHGNRSVPTIIFPDGSSLVEPSNKILIEKIDQLSNKNL